MITKFQDYLIRDFDTAENGNKAVGVNVTVYDSTTKALANLLDVNGDPIDNPVITDGRGYYSFYVEDGLYDLKTDVGTDREQYLYQYEVIANPLSILNGFEAKVFIDPTSNVITLDNPVDFIDVYIDGRLLAPNSGNYTISEDGLTVTLNVLVEGVEELVLLIPKTASVADTVKIGYITDYINDGYSASGAILQASKNHKIVDFEGVVIETDDLVEIPDTAICSKWQLSGAKLKFNYGQVIFNSRMSEIDLGGGEIDLGLTLAKVSEDGPKDAISLKVHQGHSLTVGSYVASSLDIDYLPNATNRVGYIENGDYNRIQSIVSNGDGTDTVTLTYNFLPSSNPQVYTGLIQNAWVGNASFNLTGLDFRGNPDGFLKIHNGKIKNPRGYYFTLTNGEGDLRKSTVELDVTVENAFIDMVRFQGRGITFGSNYHASRQYDLAKQHLVCSIPTDGFIKYKSGCKISRQNGDAEVFATSFDPLETLADCGVIDVEKGVLFDGTKPDDLPESDFSLGGQIYFGYNVPIHDCYHFVQPNAPHIEMGGMSFSGEVVGFQRSIYGTTFSPKDSFKTGPVNFYGAKLSCEPVFIAINGGTTPQVRMSEYPVSLDGCYIESRGLPNFDGGAYIYAKQCYIKLPLANRDTPQIEGSQNFNFITMEGGYLDGRYAIAGSDTILKNVHIPYSDDQANVPIFQNGNLPNPNDTHLILDPPLDGLYNGVQFDDVYEDIDTEKWFGANYSTRAPAPPNINFKFNNYPQLYKYGGNGGFARRYQMQLVASRADLPPLPTKGLFSAFIDKSDTVSISAINKNISIYSSERTTLTAAAAENDATVTVASAPTNKPDVIGIYQSTFNEFIYYNVDAISGTTVTIGDSYTANTGILPEIGHDNGSQVVFIRYEIESGEGAWVESQSGFTLPSDGEAHNIVFDTLIYDDTNGDMFTIFNNDRISIPAGIDRVDVSGYFQFAESGIASGSTYHLRIIQYNSSDVRVRVAAASGGTIGYTDSRDNCSSNGVPVSGGDYFVLSFRDGDAAANTIQKAYLQVRKA